jgi:hypothetical protein
VKKPEAKKEKAKPVAKSIVIFDVKVTDPHKKFKQNRKFLLKNLKKKKKF